VILSRNRQVKLFAVAFVVRLFLLDSAEKLSF